MTSLALNVPDVSCGHCKMAIEGAVGALDGVDAVAVDITAKRVDVSFDDARTDRDAIVATIEDQGYEVAG